MEGEDDVESENDIEGVEETKAKFNSNSDDLDEKTMLDFSIGEIEEQTDPMGHDKTTNPCDYSHITQHWNKL